MEANYTYKCFVSDSSIQCLGLNCSPMNFSISTVFDCAFLNIFVCENGVNIIAHPGSSLQKHLFIRFLWGFLPLCLVNYAANTTSSLFVHLSPLSCWVVNFLFSVQIGGTKAKVCGVDGGEIFTCSLLSQIE